MDNQVTIDSYHGCGNTVTS